MEDGPLYVIARLPYGGQTCGGRAITYSLLDVFALGVFITYIIFLKRCILNDCRLAVHVYSIILDILLG